MTEISKTHTAMPMTTSTGIVPDPPHWTVDDGWDGGAGVKQFPEAAEVWLVARAEGGSKWIAAVGFKSYSIAQRAAALLEEALALQDEEPPADCDHPEGDRRPTWIKRGERVAFCDRCGKNLGPVEP